MPYSVMRILVITEGKLRTDRSPDGIGAMLDAVECWRSLDSDRFRITRVQINEDDARFKLVDTIRDSDYDQIWFFGSGSPSSAELPRRPLSEPELTALRGFMDAGGGVFATGDHEDVGASLCARIPRVRHMRSWGVGGFTPSKSDRSRADTVFASRFNGDSDSEQDAVGKPIWVKCSEGQPHPLLQGYVPPDTVLSERPIGPVRIPRPSIIRWLPDHMHEGECRILPDGFDAEVRADFREGAQTEIVAWSVKRGFSDAMGLTEDKPSLHGVICCYDDRPHQAGRVVVDSTFHHWVQYNTAAMRGSPTGRDLDCYPVNIALWLSKAMNAKPKRMAMVRALGQQEGVFSVRKQKSDGLTEQLYNQILGEMAETVWAANGMSVLVLREILEEMRGYGNSEAWSADTGTAAVGAAIAESIATKKDSPAAAEPGVKYSAVPIPESSEGLVIGPEPFDAGGEISAGVGEPVENGLEEIIAADIPPKPVIPSENREGEEIAKLWERTGKLLDSVLASGSGPADLN